MRNIPKYSIMQCDKYKFLSELTFIGTMGYSEEIGSKAIFSARNIIKDSISNERHNIKQDIQDEHFYLFIENIIDNSKIYGATVAVPVTFYIPEEFLKEIYDKDFGVYSTGEIWHRGERSNIAVKFFDSLEAAELYYECADV